MKNNTNKKLIRIASDIHLEFIKGLIHFGKIIEVNEESRMNEILVLAGDIFLWNDIEQRRYYCEFLIWCSDNFAEVVIIAGNHEYYYGIFDSIRTNIRDTLSSISYNIHFLDDSSCEIDNYLFVGSTLWTDMNNDNTLTKIKVKSYMNDFRLIKREKPRESLKIFTPEDSVELNKKGREFIFSELKNPDNSDKDIIVVTHHAPSFLSVHERFKGMEENYGFVNTGIEEELANIEKKPILWFHGHTHNSFEYIMPGSNEKTTVICNPMGYYRDGSIENKKYSSGLSVEILSDTKVL